MNQGPQPNREEKKRLFEIFLILLTVGLLVGISRLESRLYELSHSLSENEEFFDTIVYFALVNVNVILILLLSFLIFRNITKIVVQRKRGVLGSKLRTKLVVFFVFFAIAPTALMFYISTNFMTTSFENWFSDKVQTTMRQTREAGARVYRQDQKRLESLAKIAKQRVKINGPTEIFNPDDVSLDLTSLEGFEQEYRLHALKVFAKDGALVWSRYRNKVATVEASVESFVLDGLDKLIGSRDIDSLGSVEAEQGQDVVIGIAPVRNPINDRVIAVIVAEEKFETQILKSIEDILVDFGSLRPGAQIIRLSFTVLMIVMSLLILFCACWLGFYVARDITGPLQNLAEATREVAHGNYDVSLPQGKDDETGQLVKAFNQMTVDLKKHEGRAALSAKNLREINHELDQRRRYMEIVLGNITSGVIAVDTQNRIASVNRWAERLLNIVANDVIGKDADKAFNAYLQAEFWSPLKQELQERSATRMEIKLESESDDLTLFVNAVRLLNEEGKQLGCVIVFDDALEQVMTQRVAAWKEVAKRIAHEIKNPITPIKLNAQRLLRRFPNKFSGDDLKVFESCMETIISQVDCLRDLVNEFSKFSRLPNVRVSPDSLEDIILDSVKLYQMSYPNISFDTQNIGTLPKLMIDREQMGRVFVNLISNSVASFEDNQAKGKISIRTEILEEPNKVRVELTDNGCGIPPKLRARVLEPYFSTKDGGTGLGLAIVNQVVSEHGGYVRIADNSPRGTKVVLELPMKDS